MSQHNIIGSEAFEGRRYIIVQHMRSGINRRRRRPMIVLALVAVLALLAGAAAAVFALAPLLVQSPATAAEPIDASKAQLRLQPVEAATPAQNAPLGAAR